MSQNESEEFHLSDEQVKSIHDAFMHFCGEREEIPVKKLADVMLACGYALKGDELEALISDVDVDASGHIDFQEFLPLMGAYIKKKEDELFYKNLFRILDKKKKGFIPIEDLRHILMGLAAELELTEEDVDDMCTSVDDDGNGEVSFEEFLELMTSD